MNKWRWSKTLIYLTLQLKVLWILYALMLVTEQWLITVRAYFAPTRETMGTTMLMKIRKSGMGTVPKMQARSAGRSIKNIRNTGSLLSRQTGDASTVTFAMPLSLTKDQVASVKGTIPGTSVPTHTKSTSHRLEGLVRWEQWKEKVEREGVGCLPGCSIKTGKLLHLAHKAASKGFITEAACKEVMTMFTSGSTLYCDYDALGKSLGSTRVFRNYKTATENKKGINQGLRKRVEASQTLCLGKFDRASAMQLLPPKSIVFPLGGVQKKRPDGSPMDEWRPASDHTKSGFNGWSNPPTHSLTATDDVARMSIPGHAMAVGDIHNAFALIPLSTKIWQYMFFTWYNLEDDDDDNEYLYANLFADFGSRGAPEAFRTLFVEVILGIARSEEVVNLCREVPIHVDDFCFIDAAASVADGDMMRFQTFLGEMGVQLKNNVQKLCAGNTSVSE